MICQRMRRWCLTAECGFRGRRFHAPLISVQHDHQDCGSIHYRPAGCGQAQGCAGISACHPIMMESNT